MKRVIGEIDGKRGGITAGNSSVNTVNSTCITNNGFNFNETVDAKTSTFNNLTLRFEGNGLAKETIVSSIYATITIKGVITSATNNVVITATATTVIISITQSFRRPEALRYALSLSKGREEKSNTSFFAVNLCPVMHFD